MDNGFLLFNKVKIPHVNMLAKYVNHSLRSMILNSLSLSQILSCRSKYEQICSTIIAFSCLRNPHLGT